MKQVIFFAFCYDAHFKSELRAVGLMAGDRPRQHEIFSIKCKFQHFKFSPPKFKETSTTSTVGSTQSD